MEYKECKTNVFSTKQLTINAIVLYSFHSLFSFIPLISFKNFLRKIMQRLTPYLPFVISREGVEHDVQAL